MLSLIRLLLAAMFIIFTSLFALVYCLLSPRNPPKHVYFFCRWFNQLQKLAGVELIQRGKENVANVGNSVYISNHQSIFDFVTDPGMLEPRTVTIGKKSYCGSLSSASYTGLPVIY